MRDFNEPPSGNEQLLLEGLSSDTREKLSEAARRNGRTIHEEAERIIRAHLLRNEE